MQIKKNTYAMCRKHLTIPYPCGNKGNHSTHLSAEVLVRNDSIPAETSPHARDEKKLLLVIIWDGGFCGNLGLNGSEYLLRKSLGYDFGGLAVPSDGSIKDVCGWMCFFQPEIGRYGISRARD